MTATAADIAAGTRPVAVAKWSSSTIHARYPSARDGSVEPAEGFCDLIADALTAVAQRGALIGVERRRFAVDVAEVLWLTPGQAVELIDTEQSVSDTFIVMRWEADLENETTRLELFG